MNIILFDLHFLPLIPIYYYYYILLIYGISELIFSIHLLSFNYFKIH